MILGLDDQWNFWLKVDKTNSCWIWTASKSGGYGQIRFGGRKGKLLKAHRVVWYLTYQEWPPEDKEVCHNCDNPSCVNPDHLYIGTHSDNMKDRSIRGRMVSTLGSNNPNATLHENDIIQIKHRLLRGDRQVDIARDFSVTKHAIYSVAKGRKWQHIQVGETSETS